MESVMNFLADNYVWFFVAAGVLCFALIGFIIESRKKQKSEFKGESIEESTPSTVATTNMNVNTNVESVVEPISEVVTKEEVIEPVVIEQNLETVSNVQDNSIEETMEINDIPISDNKPTSIEFYSGPIEMKTPVPEPSPVTVEEQIVTEPENNNDTVSYTNVFTNESVNEPGLIADEKKDEPTNYDTF